MPTFATPAPISATIDLAVGDVQVIATGRSDTVVEILPRNESNKFDVKAAAETRIDFADGKLAIKVPKPLQIYFTWRVGTVDVKVELPTGSHVRGTTAQGDMRCSGRLGECQLKTYHGDIGLHHAAAVRLTTTHGQITADRVDGDAQVTGSGDIQVTEITGAARIRNLNGPTWIGEVTGDIHVNSAHGDIAIDRAGYNVVARTAHGDVRVGDVRRGSVVIQSASGELEVGIHAGTAAWLEVKSSSGSVRNSLEVTDRPDEPAETVQIRGRTYAGDILIRRATTS